MELEIILVDDGSTDGSREQIRQLTSAENIQAFFHGVNRGKGASLRTGFSASTGDVIVVQDADLEYYPVELTKLVAPIESGRADVVYGSRFRGTDPVSVALYWHSLGNRFLTFLSNVFTDLYLTDMEVCYKAFRREVIQGLELREDRFGFEPEVTAKIAQYRRIDGSRLRIFEIGISYSGRTYKEGKKIGWRDGVSAVWCILKYNLWARSKKKED
jgi:glycosyltransferase involved in cell wall biosynthesis